MKKNLILAALIAVGLILWLLSGLSAERPESLSDTRSALLAAPVAPRMRVRVARFDAE